MNETAEAVKKRELQRMKYVLYGLGALVLVSIVFGMWLRTTDIPLGCFILALGVFFAVLDGFDSKMTVLGVVFGILGLVFLALGINKGVQTAQDMKYSAQLGVTIKELFASQNDAGTKYVVYDEQKELFRQGMLPSADSAENAEDIAAVILMNTRTSVTGYYTSGDEAGRYVVELKIRDVHSGRIIETETLYGGNPPERITKKTLSFGKKTYHGSMPSELDIRMACQTLIEAHKEERKRLSRVELLSEEELHALFHVVSWFYEDEDEWVTLEDVVSLIRKEEPDFRMEDYPFTAEELVKADPDFELDERRSDTFPYVKKTCVRWTGADPDSCYTPEIVVAHFNQIVPILMKSVVEEVEPGDLQEIIEYYTLHYTDTEENTVYYSNKEGSLNLSFEFDSTPGTLLAANSMTFSFSALLGERNRQLFELTLATSISILDRSTDYSEIISCLLDPTIDEIETEMFFLSKRQESLLVQYVLEKP